MTCDDVISSLLQIQFSTHPVDIMELCIKYNCLALFKPSFKRLVELPYHWFDSEHFVKLGHDVFVGLVLSKAIMDEQRHIIAAEEPKIVEHADDCEDPAACSKDWHAIWWNGMGCFLLDARNPQGYTDAVRRFKGLHFGHVNDGCKKNMFIVLDNGAAFFNVDRILSDLIKRLERKLFHQLGAS
ncbi:hypothetical protein ID866_12372 [Astraeus odoratus]|nr:hypothetical protein ID866_12372 [Astraeus odoratus]